MSISRERRAAVETTKRRRALSRRMSGVVMPSRRSFAVGSFHWQLRLLPRFPTAGNVPQLFKSLRLQNARGNARSVTAAAINCRLLVSIKIVIAFHYEKNGVFRIEHPTRPNG